MPLPFTTAEFLDVFRAYNEAVWPAQWLLFALGVAVVALAVRGTRRSARALSGLLVVLWLWMGVVYHFGFFRTINPAAGGFAAAFVAQAAAFAWLGAWKGRLDVRVERDAAGAAGGLLALYALVVYPLVGHLLGHRYPAVPTFGLPCPTTILTFAVLVWARAPVPRLLLVVPVAWAALGTVAALQLGMRQDLGLLVAAALGVIAALGRGVRHGATPPRTA